MKFGRMARSVVVGAIVAGFGVGAIGVAGASTPAAAKEKSLPAAQLNIVAYSTPTAAFASLISAFQATTAGKNIKFTQSYGASGDQSRAVVAGQKADIVEFSLEPDMQKLVDAGIVAPTWNQNQYKGIVTDSVAVIAARKGNPKNIKDWDDLTKPGVEVITPNPFTSGAAQVEHPGGLRRPVEPRQERAGRTRLPHRAVQARAGAGHQRPRGAADVHRRQGRRADHVRERGDLRQEERAGDRLHDPDQTILIENPVAVTKNSDEPQAGQGVPRLPLLEAGRADLRRERLPPGERPDPVGEAVPDPAGLFTIDDLGGWPTIDKAFFDPTAGKFTAIEKSLGVATSK